MATPHHADIPGELQAPQPTAEDYQRALDQMQQQYQALFQEFQTKFGTQ